MYAKPPDITFPFQFDGRNYVAKGPQEKLDRFVLPDRRLIVSTLWPAHEEFLVEEPHDFMSLSPEEIATKLNAVLATLV